MSRASTHPAPHVSRSPSARRRARRIAPAVLLSLSLMIATPVAAAPHPYPQADASVITTWNEITITTVNGGVPSPTNFNYYAFVHIAMYNAVAAITGEYELYMWNGVAPKPSSPEAAAAAAAHRVLEAYFGDSAARDAQLAASLANEPNPVARRNGEAFGVMAADHIIALRTGDGRNGPVTAPTQGTLPGQWRPTPPAFAPFSSAWLGGVRPLAVPTTTHFGPGAPPALDSPQYLADFAEVRDIGEANSPRDTFQSQTARFFSDAGILPMQRALQELALRRGLDIDDSARMFAAVETAIADGAGTVWKAKLDYLLWRPVTAIRESGLTTWSSYIPNPAYPEWPSGLCSVVGATGMVLERLFGTVDLNITSMAMDAGPQPRHYADRATFNADAINARVWSGIHFEFSDTAGTNVGTNVANYVVDNYFQPAD
jgi:hypothetical protein